MKKQKVCEKAFTIIDYGCDEAKVIVPGSGELCDKVYDIISSFFEKYIEDGSLSQNEFDYHMRHIEWTIGRIDEAIDFTTQTGGQQC
jgi:hypothetical protein